MQGGKIVFSCMEKYDLCEMSGDFYKFRYKLKFKYSYEKEIIIVII